MTTPVLTVPEVLNGSLAIVSAPGAWTQGAGARDAHGHPIAAADANAVCFCVAGAVYRAAGRYVATADRLIDRLNAWARQRGFDHIANWNDDPNRTQAEVVAALRQAATQSGGGKDE